MLSSLLAAVLWWWTGSAQQTAPFLLTEKHSALLGKLKNIPSVSSRKTVTLLVCCACGPSKIITDVKYLFLNETWYKRVCNYSNKIKTKSWEGNLWSSYKQSASTSVMVITLIKFHWDLTLSFHWDLSSGWDPPLPTSTWLAAVTELVTLDVLLCNSKTLLTVTKQRGEILCFNY